MHKLHKFCGIFKNKCKKYLNSFQNSSGLFGKTKYKICLFIEEEKEIQLFLARFFTILRISSGVGSKKMGEMEKDDPTFWETKIITLLMIRRGRIFKGIIEINFPLHSTDHIK